ncbi:MAG TPA: P1 family peptidase [Roseiflexaceae bacterium]|nr:P1 family peptidase [Roseiflexaceae bacterium]
MSPAITDVAGVLVGHAHDETALTGCTAILTVDGAVGGVDVRGGGPGTRETDLLNPVANVSVVHAITLCGGSAFGLAAATGVVDWLQERDIGYPTRIRKVPIVPAAVIYDLGLGRADRWPDAALGYAACEAAGVAVAEGCVGAGMGASVGKLLGIAGAVKSGIGTWSETLADGTVVGALAVCNAVGDVYEEVSGRILAGARDPSGKGFADSMALLRTAQFQAALPTAPASENTTLAVVATDARLTKAEVSKMAQMAQDALPRTIRPIHTPFDGDTVFALSTGKRSGPPLVVLGAIAADVLARALERCVRMATSIGGLPAARDLA